jgi:hypothetical protein
VALTRGDAWSVASLAVVDGGCCGFMKVKAVLACGLSFFYSLTPTVVCRRLAWECSWSCWSDCVGEVVVVWSW